MHVSQILIGVLVLFLGVASGSGTAEAGEQQVKWPFAGSGLRTQIDTNGDGMRAVASTAKGQTSLGPISFQGLGESLPQLAEVKSCPQGTWEYPLLMYHSVLHIEESGELLYTRLSTGVSCYDPSTNLLSFTGQGNFVGGTGQFAEASGSFETQATAKMLVPTPTGNEFESIDGVSTGTLITPSRP